MRGRARPGVPTGAAALAIASQATGGLTGRWLIAASLISAAALDLTRCSLVLTTFRHVAPAIGLVAVGLGSAALSVIAARGYRAGHHWAAWAALLIGVASAPQASASGFHNPYAIPDVATAVLGVLLTAAILATAGRTGTLAHPPESPCARHEAPFGPAECADLEPYPTARLQIRRIRQPCATPAVAAELRRPAHGTVPAPGAARQSGGGSGRARVCDALAVVDLVVVVDREGLSQHGLEGGCEAALGAPGEVIGVVVALGPLCPRAPA
jgi:hypothetical protein